ncbi:MAG: LytTR family DNA-binding domain-containing protein [Thermotaleaceae bacterium]
MLKVILIDDEKVALRELKYILNQYGEIQILGAFSDPVEALKEIPRLNPDVIFLDIEMPEVSGFAVAEQIVEFNIVPYIVFVTAYDEYAIKAFEVSAIDYILKPISPKRIGKAIEKLVKNRMHGYNHNIIKDPWQQKLKDMHRNYSHPFSKIFIYQEEGIILLNPSDILYFMIEGGTVVLVTHQRSYSIRETLNYWEERLADYGFFRCHRCYLVNIEKIEKIFPMFNSTYLLQLTNSSDEIPVSRNYSRVLKQIML